jgi:hypothetical protein
MNIIVVASLPIIVDGKKVRLASQFSYPSAWIGSTCQYRIAQLISISLSSLNSHPPI